MLCLYCKSKEYLKPKSIHIGELVSNSNLSKAIDTIICNKNDTVIVSIPVVFSLGKLWNPINNYKAVYLFKQDEFQKVNRKEFQDYQRFHYIAKDTGNYLLKYHLRSPFIKDTTLFSSTSKFFIIKP
jgi:hypothetical protein